MGIALYLPIFWITCFLPLSFSSKQITVFVDGQQVNGPLESLEASFSLPEASRVVFLNHRDSCSGAINVSKDGVGMLISLLGDYKSKPDIPVLLMTREDGNNLKDLILNSNNVTITIIPEPDRSLQRGWKVYPILFFALFALMGFGWLICLMHLSALDNTQGGKIISLLGVFQAVWMCIDLLADHWNLRGLLPRAGVQLIYQLCISPIFINIYLFCWLWYCIIDEKKNIRNQGIHFQYKLLIFILVPPLALDILRVSLVGAGWTAVDAWRVYLYVTLVFLLLAVGVFFVVGLRLRNKIRQVLTDECNSQHKYIGYVTYIGCMNVFVSIISMYVWVFKVDLFGMWSMFVFQSFWRVATLMQNGIQMAVFFPKSLSSFKKTIRTSISLPSMEAYRSTSMKSLS
mmetsp:Transcript_21283/g.29790  ORF Transcript_21283/g.29790 Transcript_21283/m.29790 type:complete len:401 (+) Transcript_21283:127-1329(+)